MPIAGIDLKPRQLEASKHQELSLSEGSKSEKPDPELNIGAGVCISIKTSLTSSQGIRNLTDPQKVCLTIAPSTP
jgi:hypothetical protein